MLATLVFFQDAVEPAMATAIQIDWKQLAALAINSVAVVLIVQTLKAFLPTLPGGVKQILALVAGPLLLLAQSAVAGALGYAIDFGPIIAVFAGLSSSLAAMGMFKVGQRVGNKVVVAKT